MSPWVLKTVPWVALTLTLTLTRYPNPYQIVTRVRFGLPDRTQGTVCSTQGDIDLISLSLSITLLVSLGQLAVVGGGGAQVVLVQIEVGLVGF